MASTFPQTTPLTPVLSQRYALKWQHALFVSGFAILFLMLAHAPLALNGPWHALRMGALGWDVNALGADDPSVPLSEGMNQPHIGWMSANVLASIRSTWGDEGVAQFGAGVLFLAYVIWARCFFVLSRSKRATALATTLLFLLANGQIADFGPMTTGFFFMALLAWMLLHVIQRDEFVPDPNRPRSVIPIAAELGAPALWWAVPLTMILWCNFTGTFLIGVVMLLAMTLHCAGQAIRSSGQIKGFWRVRRFQQSVYLFQFSVLATCVHPMGLKLWTAVFTFPRNPFWMAAGGTAPFPLAGIMGFQLLVSIGLMLWICRHSRIRIAVADFALLAILLVAGTLNARLYVWLVPTFQLFLMPHFHELLTLHSGKPHGASKPIETSALQSRSSLSEPLEKGQVNDESEYRPLQFAFSLLCLLVVWIAIAFSPMSAGLLGGQPRTPSRLYGKDVPWLATRFLAKDAEPGMLWTPAYWSDWFAVESNAQHRFYCGSNLAVLPDQVQRDYERVYLGDAAWDRILGRYAVQTLVIDKLQQDRLFNVVLREGDNWRVVFESERAIILQRRGATS